MSTTVGARDILLAAASPRLLAPPNAAIFLKTTTPVFHVTSGGSSDPSSINFTAELFELSGTVTFSASGATLTSIVGNTCSLLPANMPGATATVTATLVYRGTEFTDTLHISKVVDGLSTNNAIAYAYQRSASPPSGTPGAVTYDFTTATITTPTLANGWLKTIPAGTDPLYVTAATASAAASTDTIATGEWGSAVVLAQNGTTGANGLNSASVFIYQRNSTGTPPTLPSATTTYTFSTGGLTGLNNGWTTSVPAIGSGSYLFVSVATAVSTSTTDTIASGEWAAVQIMAQNGATGSRGAGTFYATGGSWSDATANTATPGDNVLDDVVTISDGSSFINSKRWNGSAWVAIGTVIDGSLVVTGSLQSGSFATNSVTASKINITTSGGTLNRDPFFIDYPASWTVTGTVASASNAGGAAPAKTYIYSAGGAVGTAFCTETIPIDSTKTYVLSASFYADTGNNRQFVLIVDFYDNTNTLILGTGWGSATYSGFPAFQVPTANVWAPYKTGKFGAGVSGKAIPSNAKYCKIGVYLNDTGSSSTTMAVTSLRLEEMLPGVLIKDGAITADKITTASLSAIQAELGSAVISTTGSLRSGQTAYATGTGWWLGFESGTPKFSIGNSTQYLRWTGSALDLKLDTFSASTAGNYNSPSGANGTRFYVSRTATPSGGVSPYTYAWTLQYVDGGTVSLSGTSTATVSVTGTGTNSIVAGILACAVTDSNGRVANTSFSFSATHGTPP